MKETRKNGYYWLESKKMFVPAQSTILKSAGNPSGLIQWAAKQGGRGVIWALSEFKNSDALKEKLGSPACIEWADEQAQAGLKTESSRVQDFGSHVHWGVERFLKGESLEQFKTTLQPDENVALDTSVKFLEGLKSSVKAVECEVLSEKYLFGCRTDIVLELDQEGCNLIKPYLSKKSDTPVPGLVVADFKTGSLYETTMSCQLAANAQAYKETTGKECNGALLIGVHREKPTEIKCFYFSKERVDHAFEKGFMQAYRAWEFFDSPKWFFQQEVK